MKAPNGKPTNLNEKQWLQVRTKAFKKWFGDWEHLAKVKRVKNIVPTEISSENYSAEDAERDYKNIGVATNKNTGKKAAFVNNSLWKILRHKGFNPVVIKELKSVFETSLPIIEGESKLAFYRNNTPHKEQSNIESYDHYVNKVSIDGKDYYVRFTLQNFKRSKKRTEKTSEFHSSFVSDVVLYESKSETPSVKSMNSIATEESFAFVDNRLLEWMNIVNEKDVSKIIDENGEPLVVYHGTNEKFNVFDKTKGRANMDIQGMFFSPWETDSQGYGSNVRSFFLNVKNPASFGDGFTALNKHKSEDGAGVSARLDLIKQGFDGVNNDGEEYIAFSPNQIKSATDNTGTFDSENADIRYSLAQIEESSNGKLSLNMDAPRDLFYNPMRQIYDKARHDKFVKDKTNEELEALNTAATNYDSLLKIAQQATTLACWQVRNKRDNAPSWVINRITKSLNDAERAIAVERAQMTYEIIKNRYGGALPPTFDKFVKFVDKLKQEKAKTMKTNISTIKELWQRAKNASRARVELLRGNEFLRASLAGTIVQKRLDEMIALLRITSDDARHEFEILLADNETFPQFWQAVKGKFNV